MSQYNVRIRETLERVVNVEANSMAEAKQVAAQGYRNSDYVLDASDYKGVVFEALYTNYRDYER